MSSRCGGDAGNEAISDREMIRCPRRGKAARDDVDRVMGPSRAARDWERGFASHAAQRTQSGAARVRFAPAWTPEDRQRELGGGGKWAGTGCADAAIFVARASRPWLRYAAALAGTPAKLPERSDRWPHAHEKRCAFAPSTGVPVEHRGVPRLHGRAARATISGHARIARLRKNGHCTPVLSPVL